MHWKSLRLQSLSGEHLRLESLGRALSTDREMMEIPVQIAANPKAGLSSIPGRLLIVYQSDETTQKALKRLKRRASKRGQKLQAKTEDSCRYLFLFTTAPPEVLSGKEAADLYRFRWQVELLFKRLKSQMKLGEMTVKGSQLCQAVILGKLLGALLVEELMTQVIGGFPPWDRANQSMETFPSSG